MTDEELLEAIITAERYLRALPAWKRRWLEFKWLRLDPIYCRIRCFLAGEECPWG